MGYKALMVVLISAAIVLCGCSKTTYGSKILDTEKVANQDIKSIKVTFINKENPIKSPSIVLLSNQQDSWPHIESIHKFLKKAESVSIDREINFSPPSESTHNIVVTFANDHSLEFYYSMEKNWLIWRRIITDGDNKILKFEFLRPDPSIKELLSILEKDAF